jgi:hypothetical protein
MAPYVTSIGRIKPPEASPPSMRFTTGPGIERGEVWYLLDFGDLKINLNEQQLLELFEPSL